MAKRTFPLRTQHQRNRAADACLDAPEGKVCHIEDETRNDRQNRALWAYIKQLRTALPDTVGSRSPNDVKLQFLHALGSEMRFLPELDGGGSFPVGHSSRVLTVEQFGALLTLITEYAARNGVVLQQTEAIT